MSVSKLNQILIEFERYYEKPLKYSNYVRRLDDIFILKNSKEKTSQCYIEIASTRFSFLKTTGPLGWMFVNFGQHILF